MEGVPPGTGGSEERGDAGCGTGAASRPTIGFESRTEGDYDGDAVVDLARLYAVVGSDECGPQALETDRRFELSIEFAAAQLTVPFTDRQGLFDRAILGSSDLDGDGSAELLVTHVEPGPIRLGGGQDVLLRSGFECRTGEDGSRVLVGWWAQRDDAVSPFRLYTATLRIQGGGFLVGTEDRRGVKDLPPSRGLCP